MTNKQTERLVKAFETLVKDFHKYVKLQEMTTEKALALASRQMDTVSKDYD